MKNWKEWSIGSKVSAIVGGICSTIMLTLGSAMLAFPAISEIAGLAVAQSSTRWNNVIDAARGDSQSSGIFGTSIYLFNGVTFDRVRGTGGSMNVTPVGTITPADAFANPTTAITGWSLNGVFNGTTWDRMRSATADTLAATGLQAVGNMLFNGTTWDRERTASADNLAATGIAAAGNVAFDGTTWDRLIGVSNTNNTAVTSQGVRYSTQLSTWSRTNTPAANTQATASIAAGGGTVRHVATSITWCLATDTATAVGPIAINLRDGATGAGTIIRSWYVNISLAEESRCVDLSGLNMTGSANTAMTLEFAAAGGAATLETVSFTGYSTP